MIEYLIFTLCYSYSTALYLCHYSSIFGFYVFMYDVCISIHVMMMYPVIVLEQVFSVFGKISLFEGLDDILGFWCYCRN